MVIEESEKVGVLDDLGETIVESQIESLRQQVKLYGQSIESLKKQKIDYLEQVAIDEEAWQIQLANPEKLEDKKQFRYELVPRFWELVQLKKQYEYRNFAATVKSTHEGFDFRLKKLEGELALTQEKLDELTKDVTTA